MERSVASWGAAGSHGTGGRPAAARRKVPDPGEAPRAVYLDADQHTRTLGRPVLEAAGFRVTEIGPGATTDPAARLAGATALLVASARVPRDVLEAVPSIAIVSIQAAGTDTVDVEAAAELGIWVCNVPDAASDEVATHALAMALALVRQLPYYEAQARRGAWTLADVPLPRRPTNLTVGVVGLGRIGRRFARLAAPVFGRVLGNDPAVPLERWPTAATSVALDELLAASDVVSLHLPLTAATRGLLDARRLGLLRPDAFLVNVSRGELVDLPVLLGALDEGRLAGAALDVFPVEPPDPADPVLHHPKLLVTPHVAYLSAESVAQYARAQAQNVAAWARTGRPEHVVVAPTRPRR